MSSDWQRPILFEYAILPGTAIAIDHLGLYGNLPSMSEATSEWLWRFTICVGRPRSCESEIVLRHCREALDLLVRHHEDLLVSVPRHYDGTFGVHVLEEWKAALQTIIEVASGRPTCTWIAPLRPDEPNFGRPWDEVAAEMLARLDKAISRANARKN